MSHPAMEFHDGDGLDRRTCSVMHAIVDDSVETCLGLWYAPDNVVVGTADGTGSVSESNGIS